MDEYLFIEMAKLKADREKLARAQQEQMRDLRPEQRPEERKHGPFAQTLLPLLSWR